MSSDAKTKERQKEFPFLDYHLELEQALLMLKGRPLHCARNVYRGLRRAWSIAEIDPEMAAFRAITAEEEAATALIFALQQRKYPRADELKWRQHPHKAGITPFLQTIENMLYEFKFPAPQVKLSYKDRDVPRIDIAFPLRSFGIDADFQVNPVEPLHAVLSEGPTGEEGSHPPTDFSEQLERLADDRGAKDVYAAITKDANTRNLILYASNDGIPACQDVDNFLMVKRRHITLLLSLTIAVLQTKEIQHFAVQTLGAYLRALGKAAKNGFDYSSASQSRELRIHMAGDKPDRDMEI